ncbi:MAG: asparagine synthase (glutamine-hydrolyzing) [Methylophilaceae bacterium]
MCGIAGFLSTAQSRTTLLDHVHGMTASLTHRGPDDMGAWVDADAGIALGHRRLSILDLTPAGHQPMLSVCGRFVIVFNGEIYNHLQLRGELERDAEQGQISWRGHSDTETLLSAIAAWGVETTLQKSVGMFAFAVWDREQRTLTLARDRLGEKPLYFGMQGDVLMFGSELKALRTHPSFRGEIDRDSLALYMRHNYIPAPYSIYKGIYKLLPGTWLQLPDLADLVLDPSLAGLGEIKAYWSAYAVAESGHKDPFTGSETEAVEQLEQVLKQSIGGQMIADVPLGAFLSGGVDSSAVVALMQTQANRPVKTFTIGLNEHSYNEAGYAHAVAKSLGTEHTELYVSPEQAMAVIPQLPQIYDEPFADSSQIPTWLVAKMAREHVTVCLSGDGGDELFGGYNRYFLGQSLWSKLARIPQPMRGGAADLITGLSPSRWNSIMKIVSPVMPRKLRYANPGDKLHKLAGVLQTESPESLYLGLVSHWDDPAAIVLGSKEHATVLTDKSKFQEFLSFPEQMMLLDTVSYLPDDILAKVDRAAMSVGLETRVPFLDHRVLEFAWKLPIAMKVRQEEGKHVLKRLLYRHVPKVLIERPKMGFGIPLDNWLRGPLRGWAETLLDESRLLKEGFFDPLPIRLKWQEHLSGQRNWQYQLWNVLMFQAWLEHTHG